MAVHFWNCITNNFLKKLDKPIHPVEVHNVKYSLEFQCDDERESWHYNSPNHPQYTFQDISELKEAIHRIGEVQRTQMNRSAVVEAVIRRLTKDRNYFYHKMYVHFNHRETFYVANQKKQRALHEIRCFEMYDTVDTIQRCLREKNNPLEDALKSPQSGEQ